MPQVIPPSNPLDQLSPPILKQEELASIAVSASKAIENQKANHVIRSTKSFNGRNIFWITSKTTHLTYIFNKKQALTNSRSNFYKVITLSKDYPKTAKKVQILIQRYKYFSEEEKLCLEALKGTPGIIQLYDCGRIKDGDKTTFFMVQDFFKNGDGITYLTSGLTLDQKNKLILALQMGESIEEMHKKNVIHRDIKLENYLIGLNKKPRLTDFEFSTMKKENQPLEVVGTAESFPPEIIIKMHNELNVIFSGTLKKEEPLNGTNFEPLYTTDRIDVWAYGTLLHRIQYGEGTPWEEKAYQLFCLYKEIKTTLEIPTYGEIDETTKKKLESYWEIFKENSANKIFEDIDLVLELLGKLTEIPTNQILAQCFVKNPEKRPSMATITKQIKDII